MPFRSRSQRLEHVAVALVFSQFAPADRPMAVREIAQERVEFGPSAGRRRRRPRLLCSPDLRQKRAHPTECQHIAAS